MKMRLACFLWLCAAVGCASHPGPIVDTKGIVDMRQYEQDLAECEAYGEEVSVAEGTARGAAAGAAVGAVVGAISGNADEAAGYGAAAGGVKSGVRNQRTREEVVKRCMRGRGYRVLN